MSLCGYDYECCKSYERVDLKVLLFCALPIWSVLRPMTYSSVMNVMSRVRVFYIFSCGELEKLEISFF